MKKIILFSCLLSGMNCLAQKVQTNYKLQLKQSYIQTFKITYFKRLLVRGFNNSKAINSVVNYENDGYGEPLLSMDDYRIIDSLINIDNLTMIRDSIHRIGRVSEGAQGKRIFAYALDKFNSKKMNSLALARFIGFYKKA